MFCENCGAQYFGNPAFCENCGHKLTDAEFSFDTNNEEQPNIRTTSGDRSHRGRSYDR